MLPKDASYSVTTGSDGSYEIVLSDDDTSGKFSVTASCSGFMDKTIEVEIAGYENIQNFILRPVGSVEDYQLYKFDTGASLSALGYGSAYDMMGGVKFYATELSPYVGMNLSELAFAVNCGSAANLYVVVDYDGKRVLSRKVEDPKFSGTMNVVDISDANLVIPANTAVVIGYAVQSPGGKSSGYPLLTYKNSASGGAMYQNFSLSDSLWDEYEGACIAMSARVVGDLDPGTGEITLAIMGFNSIDNPKEGAYSAGDTFTFNLLESYHNKPSSVVWYFDGAEQSAGTVTLTAGKHTVAAKLVYSDGSAEDITLELNVN